MRTDRRGFLAALVGLAAGGAAAVRRLAVVEPAVVGPSRVIAQVPTHVITAIDMENRVVSIDRLGAALRRAYGDPAYFAPLLRESPFWRGLAPKRPVADFWREGTFLPPPLVELGPDMFVDYPLAE